MNIRQILMIQSNLTIACFISSYARIETMNLLSYISENKGKFYYVDTDCCDTNMILPEGMIDKSELGKLKFEGCYNISHYLGRKQYYLRNSITGEKKIGAKGHNKSDLREEDWEKVKRGEKIIVDYWEFKKIGYKEIVKVNRKKVFSLSLNGRQYLPDGTSEALDMSCLVDMKPDTLYKFP